MAEAMEQETQGKWEYVRAEEKNKKKRAVLTASWTHRGMTAERIRRDAHRTTAAELAAAPESDVYVMTPDCGKYSRQSQTDPTEAARETETVATLLQYATAKRPAIVIMESVADLLTSKRMRACGAAIERHMRQALPDYKWYAQVVDPHRHMDSAMSRERAYWMGIKPVP
jgi:site-specific DNA-cytosine methylase